MAFFLSFLIAMFTSIVCIPPLLKIANRYKILDVPNKRKIHSSPIPRVGGVALVIATLIPIVFWVPLSSQILYLILGITVIFITGLFDDLYDLNYKIKLITQIIAASLVVYGANINFQSFLIAADTSYGLIIIQLISVFFIVGVTNALNLSDGLDGLAAGASLLSLAIISLLSIESNIALILLICLALIGGIFGFLRFNTYPAKIFMGDTGSQFLGFMLAVLSLIVVSKEGANYSTLLPLLIIGLPILDTLFVIVIRLINGKSPFSPDNNHFHHRLLQSGYPQYISVIILYTFQLIFVLSAYYFRYESDIISLVTYSFIAVSCIITTLLMQRMNTTYIGFKTNWLAYTGYKSNSAILNKVENTGIFNTIIVLLVLWYLFSALYLSSPLQKDLFYTSLILIIFPLWNLAKRDSKPLSWIERGVAYMMVVLVVYLQFQGHGIGLQHYVEVFLLICLAVCVGIKMLRYKNSGFQGSPLDFLILLLAILGPFFLQYDESYLHISMLVLKSILLFYCIEIIFLIFKNNTNIVRSAMVCHLGGIVLIGALTSF